MAILLARPAQATSVRELIDKGAYVDAVAVAREQYARSPQSAEIDQLVEALCANGEGAAAETLALAERASLHQLANVLASRGEYLHALIRYRDALAGPSAMADADERAAILEDLGHVLRLLERYDEARQTFEQALALRQARSTGDRLPLARAQEGLAAVNMRSDRVPAARQALEEALAIRSSRQADHPALASTLQIMGDLRWFEDSHADAADYYLRALTLARARLRPDHPAIAFYLRNLGEALMYESPDAGRARFDEAFAIAQRALGADHPEISWYLSDLGWASRAQGDYREAFKFYEQALAIVDRKLGPQDPRAATILNNQAALSQQIGDFDHAIALQQRVVAIWRARHGPQSPYVIRGLDVLARFQSQAGRLTDARKTFDRVLPVRERNANPEALATTLAQRSMVLTRLGELKSAQQDAERAVALLLELPEKSRADLPAALAARAMAYERLGDWAGARADREQAGAKLEQQLGPSNPLLTRLHADLAMTLARLGETERAVTLALDTEAAGRTHLRLTSQDLVERLALGYAATRPRGLDLALSLVASGKTDAAASERTLDQLIQSRAVVLDEMARRARAAVRSDAVTAGLYDALSRARQRYANLMVRGAAPLTPAQYAAQIEHARQEKEHAERALAGRSAVFRADLEQSRIDLAEVRAALPAGTALVSFVAYDDRLSGATQRAYVACVLRGASTPIRFIPIGSATRIDRLVGQWHRAISTATASRAVGESVRRLIWDPLAPALDGAERVFIVPDGALHLVSFAALPVGPRAYLVEQAPILHYLSAERDLVRDRQAALGHGLLAIGDPAFDARTSTAATRVPGTARGTQVECDTLQTMRFGPLPAARTEANAIAKLWSSRAAGDHADDAKAIVLSGAAASERAFKTQAPAQRILHLATHGFFLGGACAATVDTSRRSVGGLVRVNDSPQMSRVPATTNPLILSGLALAGANQRARARGDEDDGVLTAEEVAGLDLSGVEWAVLSACDTGIGEVKSGEGVFGLRRALHVAGARTVIMSLWAVEDRATLDWMRALYDARFAKALDTPRAVHDASLAILHARRAKGLSTQPFFWAGFVAVGDWR